MKWGRRSGGMVFIEKRPRFSGGDREGSRQKQTVGETSVIMTGIHTPGVLPRYIYG